MKQLSVIRLVILMGLVNLLFVGVCDAQTTYLRRHVDSLLVEDATLSTATAKYKPIFGVGDTDRSATRAVSHFGLFAIETNGQTNAIKFEREELAYYVLDGTGILEYGDEEIPISKNDFFYVPINTEHRFANPREDTLNMILMGFEIPANTGVTATPDLNIANADQVSPQLLLQNGHGPSSKYQLLMGTIESKRDRLAAAYQINSLYIIDFDYGGTNIPHRHKDEEEIYLVLQGAGEMVAGETAGGGEARFPITPGDVFFYPPNTLVGFYSADDIKKDRAKILAVRVAMPN